MTEGAGERQEQDMNDDFGLSALREVLHALVHRPHLARREHVDRGERVAVRDRVGELAHGGFRRIGPAAAEHGGDRQYADAGEYGHAGRGDQRAVPAAATRRLRGDERDVVADDLQVVLVPVGVGDDADLARCRSLRGP